LHHFSKSSKFFFGQAAEKLKCAFA